METLGYQVLRVRAAMTVCLVSMEKRVGLVWMAFQVCQAKMAFVAKGVTRVKLGTLVSSITASFSYSYAPNRALQGYFFNSSTSIER